MGVVPPARVAERLNRQFPMDRTRQYFEIDRLRTVPLREGLDQLANIVRNWSGGQLRDDVSLLAVERIG